MTTKRKAKAPVLKATDQFKVLRQQLNDIATQLRENERTCFAACNPAAAVNERFDELIKVVGTVAEALRLLDKDLPEILDVNGQLAVANNSVRVLTKRYQNLEAQALGDREPVALLKRIIAGWNGTPAKGDSYAAALLDAQAYLGRLPS
jgi:hypothetical protein